MKKTWILFLLSLLILAGCGQTAEKEQEAAYMNITAEQAKEIMDTRDDYILLDVRTPEEYAQAHIPGAVLIPDYELEARAAEELPNRGQMILVYCRSGRRSKAAAELLERLGYTCIREFGGIIDWPYETE